jgi:hypothetical protein
VNSIIPIVTIIITLLGGGGFLFYMKMGKKNNKDIGRQGAANSQ